MLPIIAILFLSYAVYTVIPARGITGAIAAMLLAGGVPSAAYLIAWAIRLP